MPAERTVSRLGRILALVPWVIARGAPTVAEVCDRFGITRSELAADLNLLFVCGLPPFGPGDLIEAFIEEERVIIRMADPLTRPMRLSAREAASLLIMGRAMADLEGLDEAAALRSALTKLARALTPGEAAAAADLADRVAVELDTSVAGVLGKLRGAISRRRRLTVVYHSFGRDAVTRRRVDPLVVFSAAGHWYLVAYDSRSSEERVFRVDRIKSLRETGGEFEPPAGFDPGAYAARPLFTPSPADLEAVIDVGPSAAWVAEVIPVESTEERPRGRLRLRIRTPHLAWLIRLLLNLGPAGRAIAPPELVSGVREAAGAALERYRDGRRSARSGTPGTSRGSGRSRR